MKTNIDYPTILQVIVGSQAHGLATPTSDTDYRGVFVVPTQKILALGSKPTQTNWIEGDDDNTSWELGHFLNLASHCNPTILECFLAPIESRLVNDHVDYGAELQSLFPHLWNSADVKNAFVGYGYNQRKKFLENKDNRRAKYAAAYLRVLYNAYELLTTGTFTIRIADTPVGKTVRKFKEGNFTIGEVVELCEDWKDMVEEAYLQNPDKKANLEPVNEFLLRVRKDFWQ